MSTRKWWVGPIDPKSKIVPVRFDKFDETSKYEVEFRRMWDETARWNDDFWIRHNKQFEQEQESFILELMKTKNIQKSQVSTDDMSQFHKQFLDANLQQHWDYNW